ncbi:MAG: hypothetical protein RMY34_13955 [Aulosira sp. DedQUE10]|nr:hypothetical protein [Aulosira sp. DedQUE10]
MATSHQIVVVSRHYHSIIGSFTELTIKKIIKQQAIARLSAIVKVFVSSPSAFSISPHCALL